MLSGPPVGGPLSVLRRTIYQNSAATSRPSERVPRSWLGRPPSAAAVGPSRIGDQRAANSPDPSARRWYWPPKVGWQAAPTGVSSRSGRLAAGVSNVELGVAGEDVQLVDHLALSRVCRRAVLRVDHPHDALAVVGHDHVQVDCALWGRPAGRDVLELLVRVTEAGGRGDHDALPRDARRDLEHALCR
jgi:hypothetical protein